jgi:hypothetical protein
MKAYLLLTLLLGVFILSGCGGDAGNGHWDKPGTAINPNAPTVTVVAPAVNAPAVPINTKIITAAFSKAMNPASLTITSFTLACNGTPITGGGAVTYLDAGFVATLPLPAATDLPSNASCTATITTAATAEDGNALVSNYVWNFRTALLSDTTRPSVLSTVPATTTPGPTQAISNTPIQAIFTEDMAPASIIAAGTMTVTGPGITPVSGAATPVTYNVGTRTATFIPLNPLTDGVTYTVTIKGTGLTPATDVATNALAGNPTLPLVANDYVWSFTPTALVVTIAPGDFCPVDDGPTIPTVTMSDPTSGNLLATTSTMGVLNDGKLITATFSLEMDPTTIESALPGALTTFTIMETVSGNNVDGTVAMDVTNKIATFTTSAALLADTEYTASITTDAMSAGIPPTAIACPYEWTFKTVTPAAAGVGPVNLGRAASFGVASTAGIVNVGATTVHGDVVVDPLAECNGVTVGSAGLIGECAGTPPSITGTVISPLFPDAGVTSGAVIADLRAAYIALSPAQMFTGVTTIPDGTVMGAGEGTALVVNDNLFYPGIYKTTAGGMVITGDITLDGQGDENAVFVFQSDSAITTAATGAADPHTKILLVNGAKASNVFWWVGSNQATLGTYTIFQGNILSYSSITMETGASSCGRLFAGASTDGAFVFGNNIVSVPGNTNAPADCK